MIKNILSFHKKNNFRDYGDKAIVCKSMPHAFEIITGMQNQVERVWVIGGSNVYKVFHTIRYYKIMNMSNIFKK